MENKSMVMRGLMAFCAVSVMSALSVSCNKDKTADWRSIPSDQITAESGNAVITVNEVPVTVGNAKLVASGDSEGVLTLSNVVPGYATADIDVVLSDAGDGKWTFSGNSSLTEGPSILSLKSNLKLVFYNVSVTGTISTEGKISAAVVTKVIMDGSQSGTLLTGTWNLLRNVPAVAGADGPMAASSPLWVTWTLKNGSANAQQVATVAYLASIMGGGYLADALNSVTFNENGNITAEIWPSPEIASPQPGVDGKSLDFKASHTEWVRTPMHNLAFWYAAGGYIAVVPNISAIMAEEKADAPEGGDIDDKFDVASIIEFITKLKSYGVDVASLTAQLTTILEKGFVLKYAQSGDALAVYADKDILGPVVDAFIPALPALDSLYEELKQSTDKEDMQTVQMLQQVFQMLGITKPSEFGPIWQNTEKLEIALNLTK